MEEMIGERLRRLRQERGWTQNVLGYHAGRAPSVISQVETGKREPELSTVRALAEALDIDWRYLLLGDETPKAGAPNASASPGQLEETFKKQGLTEALAKEAEELASVWESWAENPETLDGQTRDELWANQGRLWESARQVNRCIERAHDAQPLDPILPATGLLRQAFERIEQAQTKLEHSSARTAKGQSLLHELFEEHAREERQSQKRSHA